MAEEMGGANASVDSAVSEAAENVSRETSSEESNYGIWGEDLGGGHDREINQSAITDPPEPEVPENEGEEGEVEGEEKKKSFKVKVKVHGKEMELDWDSISPEKQQEYIQKGVAFTQKTQEVAKTRQELAEQARQIHEARSQIQAFQKAFQEDPIGALKQMGVDQDKLRASMEQDLYEQIQREQMPEEQRRVLAAEERAAALERQIQEQKQQTEAQRLEQAKKFHIEKIQKTFKDALDSKKLPVTPRTVKMMAQQMRAAKQRGVDLDAETLAEYTRDAIMGDVTSLSGELTEKIFAAQKEGNTQAILQYGDQLVNMLGDSVVKAIRRYDVTRHKAGSGNQPSNPMGKPLVTAKTMAPNESDGTYPMSWDEMIEKRKLRAQGIE